MIANMVLNGLQDILGTEYLTVRYADDFVVLGKTREMLRDDAVPKIKNFLKPRGLTLNKEKTCITNISAGFDFLGFNFREYPDKS
jgi:RNA-directed DNA polymerase